MKRLVIDLDDTLTAPGEGTSYETKEVNPAVVAKLRDYQQEGFEIVIQTARNMRTHQGSIGKINALTLPIIIDWLKKHEVPYHEIYVGKPWCGTEGFYVDDKAVRPAEFVRLTHEEIGELLVRDR